MNYIDAIHLCGSCTDTILRITSRNVDDREVTIRASAKELYTDWMGSCDLCPANDAPLLALQITPGRGTACEADTTGLTFEMLMEAVVEHWPEIAQASQPDPEAKG